MMANDMKNQAKGVGSANPQFLKIGQIAELTGTTTRTLRYYEELGLIAPSSRTEGRFRLYSRETVDSVILIRELSSSGFKLSEVAQIMKFWAMARTGEERHNLLMLYLERKLREVQTKIAGLKDAEAKLRAFLRQVEACRSCPEIPTELVCSICGRVEEKPLEPLLSFAWNGNSGTLR